MKMRVHNCGAWCALRARCGGQRSARPTLSGTRGGTEVAFTLLEVMIAAAIFFVGMFALLGVLSNGIHAATLLQKNAPTAGMAVADLTLTNKLEEKTEMGDFGPVYTDFRWERNIREFMTNGLFQVDVTVLRDDKVYSTMSILLFKPDSTKKM